MIKSIINITLVKKRTTVEIKAVDNWIFDLRYLVNGREKYYCQIIKSDVSNRVDVLKREGFKGA